MISLLKTRFATACSGALLALLAGLSVSALRADSGVLVPQGTWTLVLTHGIPAEANGWEQLVYVPAIKQSIMLAQYHQRNSEPNESIVGYSFDTNSWDVLDVGGNFHTEAIPEGGESQGYFGFDPNSGMIVYHCCTTGSNQSEDINHDWWYDVLGQSGRDKHTSPKPPAALLLPGGDFDAAHNVFVLHGGAPNVGTWAYDPVANSWRQMFPGGNVPDPSLDIPGVAYSKAQQKFYLFGGQSENTHGYGNDIYVYDYPTNTWTLITPSNGTKPPGRTSHAFAYDSTNNIFLLYGGKNDSGILNDTWIYDPVANTWTQVTTPAPNPSAIPIFAKVSYDPDHNVFVMAQVGNGGGYYGGSWNTYGITTWLFRYAGGGPNAGTQVSTASTPSGGLNRYNSGWAKDPALASDGNSLYVAWSEIGSPFTSLDDAWPHIYVDQYSGGAWTPLGTSYSSISYNIFEAHQPSLAVVNGAPWVSFYQSSNTGQVAEDYGGGWDGISAWNIGAVGTVSGGTVYQGQSQIIAVGAVPHVALLEEDRNVYPQRTQVYVKAWNGSAWATKGSTLNVNTGPGATALGVSIASDGVNPAVAWSEYVHTANPGDGYDHDSNPQIYVSQWNGTQWVRLGSSSLNVTADNWAYDPSITCLNNTFYVAWVERTQTGNNQLYVKTWNGTTWTLVGSGALNQGAADGWAYHPSLVADAANNILYLGWVEQTASGQKAQVFVSKYDGHAWTSLGGALNADPVNGSAQRVSIGVWNHQPVAAWGEVNLGATRLVFVKRWTGSSWELLPGPPLPDTTPPSTPVAVSATLASPTQINLSWARSNDLVGVTGYSIYRNGVQTATVTSRLTYQDTSVAANTSYCYTVTAFDAAGNVSPQSAPACVGISVTLSPSSIVGGGSTTSNTVTLSSAAPAGGAVVTLSSSNTAVATVPATVTVPAGATVSPAFTITTTAVTAATNVTISATYAGSTGSSILSVNPAPPATASTVTLSPGSVQGGNSTTQNTVTLSSQAPAGGAAVRLTSSNTAVATVPASVTVAAGATVSPVFTIATTAVTAATTVTISAAYGGTTATATLAVNPAGVVTVSTVTLSPAAVVGGNPTTLNTVTLSAPAPAAGAVVTLASSNTAVAAVPASVTVAAGATVSPAFTINTTAVTATTGVTITAGYGSSTATASLSVTPASGNGSTLLLHGNASEVSAGSPVPNGTTVIPAAAPAGFTGTVVNTGGSVNFAAGGNGVFFLNCCNNTSNAYYHFTGTGVGTVFGASQGQISFNLTSSYSYAQRVAQAPGQRYAFDVVDGSGNHVFNFMTQITTEATSPLAFTYTASGATWVYYVPAGTEDALFGKGVLMPVTITWNGSSSQLYLNGVQVSPIAGTTANLTPHWNSASAFDLGAYEYQTFGGYSSCDDTIAEFSVGPLVTVPAPGVSAVTLSPASVLGGSPATQNTVTLNGPAPSGGAVVTLASKNAAAVVPATVTVPAGATVSPAFTITTAAVASATTAVITASAGGATATANLTINPPGVSALTLSPAAVVGGNPATQNVVTLNSPAPAGGAVVTLTSSNSSVATLPASVTVAAGSTQSLAFTISTTAVTAAASVTISASYGGAAATATLVVNPPGGAPAVSLVTLSPSSVAGGNQATQNTVTLNSPAPAGGAVVALTSSNPAVATLPASVTVAAGATVSPAFTIATTAVTSATSITVSASSGGATATATLVVNPPGGAASSVSLVTLSPASVVGGNPAAQNTVTLNNPAPAGGAVVSLTSSNTTAATVPATVTVAAGATTSPAFTISTTAVTAATSVTISASYGGATATATLLVSAPGGPAAVSLVTLSPAAVVGGNPATQNTVTLNNPAPAGGAVVSLTSSNTTAATVPATVTVAAGATTSPAFTISTTAVTAATSVTISASYGGATATATLTVNPPQSLAVSAVTLSPVSVQGGTPATQNTVTLNSPAPAGGAVVNLASSNTAVATVPATVTVAAGATISPVFTIATGAVTATTSVTILASYGGATVQASLSVTAPSGACTYTVSPLTLQAPAAGGTLTVNIQTAAGCAWTVTGLPSWLSVSGASSGSGSGDVTLIAAANTGAALTAAIQVAGAAVTVNQPAAANTPVISAVVNGASFLPGIGPNAFITIYGSGLSSTTRDWSTAVVDGNLPTSLAGVNVTVGGQMAYVEFVSPTQINAIAPDIGAGSFPVIVTNSLGASAPFTATAVAFSPAFFSWPGGYVVATHQDFSLAVANGTFPGLITTPAKPGDVIILWGTGFGPTVPIAPPGAEVLSGSPYLTANPVNVTVGGIPAVVYGVALAPGFASTFQVAIQIPPALANGDYPVVASVGGVQSPVNGTTGSITIQQ